MVRALTSPPPPPSCNGHSDFMQVFFYMDKGICFFKQERPEMDDFEEEKIVSKYVGKYFSYSFVSEH